MGADDLPRDAEGNVIAGPSDDELIPRVSDDTHLDRTPLPALGPTWNSRGNPAAPRRDTQSAPPAEPDPRDAGTEGAASAQEGLAFTQRGAMGIPASQFIAVSKGQLRRAGEEPARGWQSYSAR